MSQHNTLLYPMFFSWWRTLSAVIRKNMFIINAYLTDDNISPFKMYFNLRLNVVILPYSYWSNTLCRKGWYFIQNMKTKTKCLMLIFVKGHFKLIWMMSIMTFYEFILKWNIFFKDLSSRFFCITALIYYNSNGLGIFLYIPRLVLSNSSSTEINKSMFKENKQCSSRILNITLFALLTFIIVVFLQEISKDI